MLKNYEVWEKAHEIDSQVFEKRLVGTFSKRKDATKAIKATGKRNYFYIKEV